MTFGETTFVILVNPPLNEANEPSVPTPGTVRSGVNVSVQGGPSGTTDANGVVVLSKVEPGTKTISLSGGGLSGAVSVSITEKDLREVAVALTSSGASIMANVRYARCSARDLRAGRSRSTAASRSAGAATAFEAQGWRRS